MKPLLIGGSPGTGKTTVTRALADGDEHAVCIETDVFFDFVRHRIHPAEPESHSQNHTVISAYCQAARAYADGGYQVYLEGVLGPWFLPVVRSSLDCDFDYIILHASLAEVQRRVAARTTQAYVSPGVIEGLHPQFEKLLADYPDHVIHTDSTDIDTIVSSIQQRRAMGASVIHRDHQP